MEPILNLPVNVDAVSCATWPNVAQADAKEAIQPLPETSNLCTVVVNLPGKVTAREVRRLMRDLKAELAVDQPCVVLDMRDVKEMDTAGLDLLLRCVAETIRRDGTIHLRGISPEAATVLELTGMDQILGLAPEKTEIDLNLALPQIVETERPLAA